ncbi:MAG: hypothetical protein EAZ71_06860 [Verrucomicrobia bacterium]|nr:MAG: hypothetical protein EAZ82_12475 [Verrucomicrobiota bacterium]TAF25857.1 MAG: hypothetical protein EAZ71_06860 [Verrucomicrobiota bacterium]
MEYRTINLLSLKEREKPTHEFRRAPDSSRMIHQRNLGKIAWITRRDGLIGFTAASPALGLVIGH